MMSESAKSAKKKTREQRQLYSVSYMATLHNHDEKMRVFCEDMEKHGSQASACRAAGIDRGTSANWKKKYPEFAQAWDDAFQNRLDALEKALFKRGEDTSDRAAFGMLKAHRRETYGDKVEVTRKGKIVLGWPEGEKEENKKETSFSAKAKAAMPNAATTGKITELCPTCNRVHASGEYCPDTAGC